ncbi:MAG TPA: SRPBCC family protein [Anaeromyxobacteraceae bacterium]|nr:SRPBCC family protein [Anaeromyxobacteraceae bacterium]
MLHRNAARKVITHQARIHAPLSKVFPLLCPVREYEWIDGWSCDLVYSESGFAEKGAIFTTEFRPEGASIWTITRHEPFKAVEFVVVFPGSHVMSIEISLTAIESGETKLDWTCIYTSLVEPNEFIASVDQESFNERQEFFDRALNYYCRTGQILRR